MNYFWQESDLIIENLNVGFNKGTMYDIDEIVRFDKAQATASALTLRPDFWLFPFLNIYGIFGKSQASTDVGFGVWIPDSTDTPKEIFSMDSKVEFISTTAGFGLTPTIGVGGGWIALDMNFTWSDVPQLDKPAFIFIFGPRFGKTFKFKQPERNIAKHEAANSTLIKAGEIMNAADAAVGAATTSTVQYSMDKRPKDMWNFIIGSQFQINKHFMMRAEVGFLSSRTQVNAGLQYRFGL